MSSSDFYPPDSDSPSRSLDEVRDDPPVDKFKLDEALIEIARQFSGEGDLANNLNKFTHRDSQTEMAKRVLSTIYEQKILYAEAGTGTGKTFAYLVPALLYGGRVIISTASKTLQDQLFKLDLPTVINALHIPVSVALLKGRSNYVCHFHLKRNLETNRFHSPEEGKQLREIVKFAKSSSSGDIATFHDISERAPVWMLATASKDNCLSSECDHYNECFLMAARKNAMNADVVVVNHHLYFADAAIKDGGAGELLPSANTIIFDEAHQIPDIVSQYFGQSISSHQLIEFSRDLMRDGTAEARDGANWVQWSQEIEQQLREWRVLTHNWQPRLARDQIPDRENFLTEMQKMSQKLSELLSVLEGQAERAKSIQNLAARCAELIKIFTLWQQTQIDHIYWVEASPHQLQLNVTPLSITKAMTGLREKNPGAWIFTSATLAVKKDFSYFANKLGLSDTQSAFWPSPFDYQNNALLYVPAMQYLPNHPSFNEELSQTLEPILSELQGRTFVLCTSLKAVSQLARLFTQMIENNQWNIKVLEQGSKSPQHLLQDFRNQPNSIFIGSYSFWEGVDIAGDGLLCVVIDKLPFVVPDDPVLVARLKALENEQKNGFMDYQVPEATIALKQGAGRLIRGELDKGILVIGDTRIVDKPYGKIMWHSLPPFRRTREAETAKLFAQQIKTTPIPTNH